MLSTLFIILYLYTNVDTKDTLTLDELLGSLELYDCITFVLPDLARWWIETGNIYFWLQSFLQQSATKSNKEKLPSPASDNL